MVMISDLSLLQRFAIEAAQISMNVEFNWKDNQNTFQNLDARRAYWKKFRKQNFPSMVLIFDQDAVRLVTKGIRN